MDMTAERWRYTNEYSRKLFGGQDAHLEGLLGEAGRRGLPDIAVGAEVGRLLMILTALTRGRLAIWIARGLARGGRLITIARDPGHADFAAEQLERAGVADRVELRRGEALTLLPALAREIEPGSVDVVFIDAEKTEYPQYWKIVRPLIAEGGLILADNAYGAGTWWIDEEDDPKREAADRFNRLVADDPDFESVIVPLREGVLIGRRSTVTAESSVQM